MVRHLDKKLNNFCHKTQNGIKSQHEHKLMYDEKDLTKDNVAFSLGSAFSKMTSSSEKTANSKYYNNSYAESNLEEQ